jgi:hypothetical protein
MLGFAVKVIIVSFSALLSVKGLSSMLAVNVPLSP